MLRSLKLHLSYWPPETAAAASSHRPVATNAAAYVKLRPAPTPAFGIASTAGTALLTNRSTASTGNLTAVDTRWYIQSAQGLCGNG